MTKDYGEEVPEGVVKSQKPNGVGEHAVVAGGAVARLSAESLWNPSASLCPTRPRPPPPLSHTVQATIVSCLGGCGSLPSGLPASTPAPRAKAGTSFLYSLNLET